MANRLKELRIENNYTQKELADFLGVTPKAVSFYELGQRQIPNESLVKLSVKFAVSTDYILGKSDEKQPQYPSEQIKELAELFDKLSKEDQDAILRITKGMATKN